MKIHNTFKITATQLNKLNKKVKSKYPEVNICFTFYRVLQIKYTELKQNNIDIEYYQQWSSIIANAKTFDDIYYNL